MERKERKMRKYSGKGTSARRGKRWFALLLCLCLIGTTVPVTARAEESGSGLCEHHKNHTEDCGYEEPVEEHACEHECTEDCNTQGNCPHENDEHDDTCGYQPAVEGKPCNYDCEFCESDGTEQPDEQNTFAVEEVEEMIDALLGLEEVEAMSLDEQEEVYNKAADAAEAFDTLSDED